MQHRELSDGDFARNIVPTLGKGNPVVPVLYKLRRGNLDENALMEEVVAAVRTGAGGSSKQFALVQEHLCNGLTLESFNVRNRVFAIDE